MFATFVNVLIEKNTIFAFETKVIDVWSLYDKNVKKHNQIIVIMKKIFSFVLFLSAFFHCVDINAKLETITVGTGTNGSYDVPFGCYYNNATCQFILTSTELNAKSGVISAIAFDVAQATSYSTNEIAVYLGTTSISAYANASDYINPSEMTLVYNGTPTLGKNKGWEKINFITPFEYDGKSNLVVTIGKKSSRWTNKLLYNTSNVPKVCLLRQNDNEAEYGDPTQTTPAFSLQTIRPNVQVIFGMQTKKTINGVTYLVEGDEAIVVGYDESFNGVLNIEQNININGTAYPVSAIANSAFEGCSSITSVAIPEHITSLGEYIFCNCPNITEVTISKGVKLPAHAFQKCSALTTVKLPSDMKEIPDFAFGDCNSLVGIDIPKSVVRIGNGAFMNCSSLESIDLPDGLTDLGAYSFKNCKALTSVKIPEGITSIGDQTFYYCSKLKNIEFPSHLTSIGGFAFYYASLVDFEWPSSLENIGTHAFSANSFTEINLPNSVKSIGRGAFYYCRQAVSVTIPEGIEEIPDDAFNFCYELKTVTLPSSLTTIAKRAFAYCPIRYINWPDNLTTLGYKAFSGISPIYSPIIPKNVNNAGRLLFYGNSDLSSVYCYSETVMPDNTFLASDMKESTLYVKPNVLEKFKASSLASIFKQILPLGDTNGDGEFNIVDVVNTISLLKKSPAAMESVKPGASDINGDGIVGVDDVEQLKEYIIKK